MAEYPKVSAWSLDEDNHTWETDDLNPTDRVVPIDALVIERDDNGQWPIKMLLEVAGRIPNIGIPMISNVLDHIEWFGVEALEPPMIGGN